MMFIRWTHYGENYSRTLGLSEEEIAWARHDPDNRAWFVYPQGYEFSDDETYRECPAQATACVLSGVGVFVTARDLEEL